MAAIFSPLWTHLTSEGRHTGTWRAAIPAYEDQPSPCLGACPVNGRIPTWIRQAKEGDIRGAFETLCENNPFPAIAGRICHHPCETACNRAQLDETVGIRSLERHVGDIALAQGWPLPGPQAERAGRVAVVGSGPAGLSAAYQLRRRGFAATIFEAGDKSGGLLRTGIPAYRLARKVLDGEIGRVLDMGIELRLNAPIAGRDELEALRRDFDAVFLATGASLPKRLPALDYDRPFVRDGAAFLAATEARQRAAIGDHVLVIGGGSAAMDVARSARRHGAAVTVLSLEGEGRLPAQRTEVEEAAEEGVRFVAGAMLDAAAAKGEAIEFACVRVDFTPPNGAGPALIARHEGSGFTLTASTVIPAIGQDADLARWAGLLEAAGPVIATGFAGRTAVEGVHAGGDVASMERFVTRAMGMGKEAAKAIAARLDRTLPPPAGAPRALVGYGRINTAYQSGRERARQGEMAVEDRLGGFGEVQLALGDDEAREEAGRCFSCGACITCDNCLYYCPDMAIVRQGESYLVNADYCKGCGLCVAECPTGSIHMREDKTR